VIALFVSDTGDHAGWERAGNTAKQQAKVAKKYFVIICFIVS